VGVNTHTYADGPNGYAITVDITDEDGEFIDQANAKSVTVDNVAPTASGLTGDASALESGVTTHTYTYSLSDPGTDDITAHPSCGVGGVLGANSNTNSSGSFVCTFPDGPASPTVSVFATDSDAPGNGNPGNSQSILISVANVDPTAALGNNGPVAEGTAATISFSGQTDPSPNDTTAGFRYAYSCTNGDLSGATYAGTAGSTASTACTFGDNGSYTVKARIIDKDNGFSEYTTTVVVNNAAPIQTNQSFVFNPFTGTATASVTFSEQGWLDSVTSLFNWGGTPDAGSPASYGPGAGTGPLTGTFTSSNDFEPGCVQAPVSVTVSDDDGGSFTHTYATSLNVYTVTWDAPIKDGQRNVVKKGNVIPVKIRIVDCFGNAITDRTLNIRVVAGVMDPADIDDGIYEIPGTVSGADTTGFMRQIDGKYMYNMATKTLSVNMPYTIVIREGNVLVATAVISTK
jgi:large repetitive protein